MERLCDVLEVRRGVTAVIGVSRAPAACVIEGCEACGKKDCAFRR